jgi:hypothetical protein
MGIDKNNPKSKETESVPVGTLILVIAPILALIALGFAISPAVGIAFAAITFASVIGVTGYSILKDRKSKAMIHPESSSDTITPPLTTLPTIDPNPAPTPSITTVQEHTTESVPENTSTRPTRGN